MSEENVAHKDSIKVQHLKASNYSSHYVNGATMSGPTEDGMYHLTFFSDSIRVESETLGFKDGHLGFYIDKADMIQFREDKATITISLETIKRIQDLMNRIVSETTQNQEKE